MTNGKRRGHYTQRRIRTLNPAALQGGAVEPMGQKLIEASRMAREGESIFDIMLRTGLSREVVNDVIGRCDCRLTAANRVVQPIPDQDDP